MSARHGIDSAFERFIVDRRRALRLLDKAIADAGSIAESARLFRLRAFVLTGRIGGAS